MPFPRTAAAALAVALAGAAPAAPACAADPELSVLAASVAFDTNPRNGFPSDSMRVRGRFPDLAALRAVDRATAEIRFSVHGAVVVTGSPPHTARSLRIERRRGAARRWTLRVAGAAGSTGERILTADARTGRLDLRVRRADLGAIRSVGPRDVPVAMTVGATTARTAFSFRVVRASPPVVWGYNWTLPAPPSGALPVTSIVAGALVNVARPEFEVVTDATALAALWTALGNPSQLPQVDFGSEMVVVVSSPVAGLGPYLPGLGVSAVRASGGVVTVDWQLFLCEEPYPCPSAPDPVTCPFATPFHVVRTTRAEGTVQLRQLATAWVCP